MRVAELVRRAQGGRQATATLARVIGWTVFVTLASVIVLYVAAMAVMGVGLGGRELAPYVLVFYGALGFALVGLLWMGVYLWSLAVAALVKYLGTP